MIEYVALGPELTIQAPARTTKVAFSLVCISLLFFIFSFTLFPLLSLCHTLIPFICPVKLVPGSLNYNNYSMLSIKNMLALWTCHQEVP